MPNKKTIITIGVGVIIIGTLGFSIFIPLPKMNDFTFNPEKSIPGFISDEKTKRVSFETI